MVHAGLGAGVSPAGVHLSVHRFLDAVLDLKPLYLKMATAREMRETANEIQEKYGIKNFSLGVDGKIFPISGRPRFKEALPYWSHKVSNTNRVNLIIKLRQF